MDIVKRSNFFPASTFFDDFLTKNMFDLPGWTHEGSSIPKTNILETSDDFRVEMAAPGMHKKDFHLELDNDMLTVQTETTNTSTTASDGDYKRREFNYASFKRSFHLPNTVEAHKIEATYKDGILKVVIPKKEEAKKKPVKTIAIS